MPMPNYHPEETTLTAINQTGDKILNLHNVAQSLQEGKHHTAAE